ncbi:DUF6218 family protein [Amycolatopsis sp. NPDC051045]|uniref:DUF6218 family protein n=1 Tax=Amycolatopsis sp. NPDC051045 TaxID=3156922 RepID=UPI0034142464
MDVEADDSEVQDFTSLQHVARISAAPGTLVVSEVLSIARTLRWLVSVRAETEQVKNRRRYVRAEHGDPELSGDLGCGSHAAPYGRLAKPRREA